MRGLFGTLAGISQEKSNTTYGEIDLWNDLFRGRATVSGVAITWKRALEVTTALRCASIIAEGICSVPFKLYQRVEKNGNAQRREARDHPLWTLIHAGPNDWQTSYEFRETIGLHLALCGNAYVFKNRVRGQIVELIPFVPSDVVVERAADWTLTYRVNGPDGTQQVFPDEAIWHVRGRSWNSWMGLETIHLAREALGLAIATEESHARMHDKGVRPSGVLSVEGTLDEAQFLKWRKWVDAYYAGRENAGKALILDRAAKWQSQQMSGVDAQHIQTRGFQIEEICRAFGVLPIMVGYTGDKSATYASAEQMFLAHVVHSIRPWHRRIEQSADKFLLTSDDIRKGFYTGFVDAELLRGDAKTRAEYNKIALGGSGNPGWLSPNDVRAFDELEPRDGLDHIYAPTNSGPIGADGVPMVPKKEAPGNVGNPAPQD